MPYTDTRTTRLTDCHGGSARPLVVGPDEAEDGVDVLKTGITDKYTDTHNAKGRNTIERQTNPSGDVARWLESQHSNPKTPKTVKVYTSREKQTHRRTHGPRDSLAAMDEAQVLS